MAKSGETGRVESDFADFRARRRKRAERERSNGPPSISVIMNDSGADVKLFLQFLRFLRNFFPISPPTARFGGKWEDWAKREGLAVERRREKAGNREIKTNRAVLPLRRPERKNAARRERVGRRKGGKRSAASFDATLFAGFRGFVGGVQLRRIGGSRRRREETGERLARRRRF